MANEAGDRLKSHRLLLSTMQTTSIKAGSVPMNDRRPFCLIPRQIADASGIKNTKTCTPVVQSASN
jgi:hypothetical protein